MRDTCTDPLKPHTTHLALSCLLQPKVVASCLPLNASAMSKRAAAASDDGPARKRPKAVSTHSILTSFLLLKTSLDDTILRSELVEDLDIGNGSGTKGQKKKSLASVSLSLLSLSCLRS